jgi:hypothetical protein
MAERGTGYQFFLTREAATMMVQIVAEELSCNSAATRRRAIHSVRRAIRRQFARCPRNVGFHPTGRKRCLLTTTRGALALAFTSGRRGDSVEGDRHDWPHAQDPWGRRRLNPLSCIYPRVQRFHRNIGPPCGIRNIMNVSLYHRARA